MGDFSFVSGGALPRKRAASDAAAPSRTPSSSIAPTIAPTIAQPPQPPARSPFDLAFAPRASVTTSTHTTPPTAAANPNRGAPAPSGFVPAAAQPPSALQHASSALARQHNPPVQRPPVLTRRPVPSHPFLLPRTPLKG